ncbi:MAG: MBL fold metallo-hydrolase, partial [Clostridia bacterium]|nr:MBL fold metallo-hydrolase [Clostridia bacterium]
MQTKTARTQKSKAKESASKTKNPADTATKKKTAQNAAKSTQKNTAADKKEVQATKESNAKKSASSASVSVSKTNKKTAAAEKRTRSSAKAKKEAQAVRVTFLGGINEIGKNLTVFEYDGEMVIVDCGMTFPDADMPGIDYVLPDFSFIERNAEKIKAVFITHGHEDHIGGLPYLLKTVNIPVYATRLTMGLIEGKLREHRIFKNAKLHTI